MNDIVKTSVKSNWRDILPVHPACEIIPPNSPEEKLKIGRSIRRKGMLMPIVVLATPVNPAADVWTCQLLDGATRLDGPELAGGKITIELDAKGLPFITSPDFCIPDPKIIFDPDGTFDVLDFVVTMNVHCRHLKKKQWQKILDDLIVARPSLTDHAIASMVGISHHTVRSRRRVIGKLPIAADRIEANGKKARGRKPGSTVKPEKIDTTAPIVTDVNLEVKKDTAPPAVKPVTKPVTRRLFNKPIDPSTKAAEKVNELGLAIAALSTHWHTNRDNIKAKAEQVAAIAEDESAVDPAFGRLAWELRADALASRH
jgi:hypothetical protein